MSGGSRSIAVRGERIQDRYWQSRSAVYIYKLYRETRFNFKNDESELHEINQRFQQEANSPEARNRVALYLLHYVPCSRHITCNPGNGSASNVSCEFGRAAVCLLNLAGIPTWYNTRP